MQLIYLTSSVFSKFRQKRLWEKNHHFLGNLILWCKIMLSKEMSVLPILAASFEDHDWQYTASLDPNAYISLELNAHSYLSAYTKGITEESLKITVLKPDKAGKVNEKTGVFNNMFQCYSRGKYNTSIGVSFVCNEAGGSYDRLYISHPKLGEYIFKFRPYER